MDALVLAALSCGRKDGYEVTRWIEARTKGTFAFDDGAVYRSLHRLEGYGWVDTAWGMTADNHRSRFYCLTASGERRLRVELLGEGPEARRA